MRQALCSAVFLLFFAVKCGWAATPSPTAEVPTPYLPSTRVAVEEMLRLADVQASDLVVDLGSGDGRIPITAAVAFVCAALVLLDVTPVRILLVASAVGALWRIAATASSRKIAASAWGSI